MAHAIAFGDLIPAGWLAEWIPEWRVPVPKADLRCGKHLNGSEHYASSSQFYIPD
jgi:hypothetical protein